MLPPHPYSQASPAASLSPAAHHRPQPPTPAHPHPPFQGSAPHTNSQPLPEEPISGQRGGSRDSTRQPAIVLDDISGQLVDNRSRHPVHKPLNNTPSRPQETPPKKADKNKNEPVVRLEMLDASVSAYNLFKMPLLILV